MSKKRIKKNIYERCLLTDVCPYETALPHSNWGAYNYYKKLINNNPPKELRLLFENHKTSIPYRYEYSKDLKSKRALSLMHPAASGLIVNLYQHYETMIVKLCKRSSFSIRYPHSVAKYFGYGLKEENGPMYIEQLDENKAYASSYFSYMHFSHLHKFFESDAFTDIEKRFSFQKYIDVSKCFPSIYTHSISWAVRGKMSTKNRLDLGLKKDKSFGSTFDKLMQCINHNETNGIIVGPELSRLFAEIIFQSIDLRLEQVLNNEHSLMHGINYCCVRYIDDYYFFYNEEFAAKKFTEELARQLLVYKLYINNEKTATIKRPFITGISVKKMAISKYINELGSRIDSDDSKNLVDSQKEINIIRSILKSDESDNHAITNFFLKGLANKMYKLHNVDSQRSLSLVKVLIDISFYWLRTDTRVSTVYRMIGFVVDVLNIIKKYESYQQTVVLDKLFYEVNETIKAALVNESIIEVMNLLIAAAELGEKYLLDDKLLECIVHSSTRYVMDDVVSRKRLTYFEICTVLYYIKSNDKYTNLRLVLCNEVCRILAENSIKMYAESAHLLLDIVSCPYVDSHF